MEINFQKIHLVTCPSKETLTDIQKMNILKKINWYY